MQLQNNAIYYMSFFFCGQLRLQARAVELRFLPLIDKKNKVNKMDNEEATEDGAKLRLGGKVTTLNKGAIELH